MRFLAIGTLGLLAGCADDGPPAQPDPVASRPDASLPELPGDGTVSVPEIDVTEREVTPVTSGRVIDAIGDVLDTLDPNFRSSAPDAAPPDGGTADGGALDAGADGAT